MTSIEQERKPKFRVLRDLAKVRALEIRRMRFKTRSFPSPKPFLPPVTPHLFLNHPPLLFVCSPLLLLKEPRKGLVKHLSLWLKLSEQMWKYFEWLILEIYLKDTCSKRNAPCIQRSLHLSLILSVNIQNQFGSVTGRGEAGQREWYCTSTWLFWKKKKKSFGELILNLRHCSFVVQLLPSNPVFVLPTIATEAFHCIYLLFISLQLPKINAKQGSEAFSIFIP